MDSNSTMQSLERIIKNVTEKLGLLQIEHEVGEVVELPTIPGKVLVRSLIDDIPPQYITCVVSNVGYNIGDRVLIQYLNRDNSNKVVIATLSQNALEDNSIDYRILPETPYRLHRESLEESKLYIPPCRRFSSNGGKTTVCPPVPRVIKIVYGEGSELEWSETYNRDARGYIFSITTTWPPSHSISFTNYIVRDEQNYLMEYYGPSATGEKIN